jgi:hypothetical protein
MGSIQKKWRPLDPRCPVPKHARLPYSSTAHFTTTVIILPPAINLLNNDNVVVLCIFSEFTLF